MWLVANDLEEYAEEFSNKSIDGKQLLNLDGSKLKVMPCSQGIIAIIIVYICFINIRGILLFTVV